jgi:hypothetical protein
MSANLNTPAGIQRFKGSFDSIDADIEGCAGRSQHPAIVAGEQDAAAEMRRTVQGVIARTKHKWPFMTSRWSEEKRAGLEGERG